MSSIFISLLSSEHQKKGRFVFPPDALKGTVAKAEAKIFTANGAKLTDATGNGVGNSNNDSCKLVLRPLERDDFDRGYLDLLKQLTEIGDISPERFEERFCLLEKSAKAPAAYYVCVLEDTETQRVIGSATLALEWKFIRNCGIRGRVEDVVVDKNYRGKHLAKILLTLLVELAKDVNVYKLSLECKDPLVSFYSQFGFIKEPNQNIMAQRLIE